MKVEGIDGQFSPQSTSISGNFCVCVCCYVMQRISDMEEGTDDD